MKTLLHFLFPFFGLWAGAFLTTGQTPDAALVFASAFAAGLSTWTFRQYDRQFPPLLVSRVLRMPLPGARRNRSAPPQRLAA